MPEVTETRAVPVFGSASIEPLFVVRSGVPIAQALEEATELIDQASGSIAALAADLRGIEGDQARAVGTILYSARAILDALDGSASPKARTTNEPTGEAA